MPRILTFSDSPSCITGFGSVVRSLFTPMLESGFVGRDDLAFWGINFDGVPHETPFRIWPATSGMVQGPQDPYGRLRFVDYCLRGAFGAPFDILFVLLDHFTVSQPININGQMVPFLPALIQLARQQPVPPFRKVVQYVPVDSESVSPNWINWMPGLVDQIVAYTQFGKRVLLDTCPQLESKLSVIYHGTNPELFYPLPAQQREEFRAKALGLKPDDLLLVNPSRNQPRKDVTRTIQVFKEIRKHVPQAKLYLHMNPCDSMGFNLDQLRANLQLPQDCVKFPAGFSEGVGVPVEVLNLIYNAADLVITTARGEGWGLGVTEAMCAGTPVLAPDHTSFSEILADGRGALVPPELCRQVMLADNDQLRPVADVMAMAEKSVWLLRHPEERMAMAAKGRKWALSITWRDHIVPQWKAIFDKCDPKRNVAKPVRLAFNAGVGA